MARQVRGWNRPLAVGERVVRWGLVLLGVAVVLLMVVVRYTGAAIGAVLGAALGGGRAR